MDYIVHLPPRMPPALPGRSGGGGASGAVTWTTAESWMDEKDDSDDRKLCFVALAAVLSQLTKRLGGFLSLLETAVSP